MNYSNQTAKNVKYIPPRCKSIYLESRMPILDSSVYGDDLEDMTPKDPIDWEWDEEDDE